VSAQHISGHIVVRLSRMLSIEEAVSIFELSPPRTSSVKREDVRAWVMGRSRHTTNKGARMFTGGIGALLVMPVNQNKNQHKRV
jgi:hypothetical protein